MLAISPSTKQDLIDRGLPADHIWVVPPGVDHTVYKAPSDERPREPVVVWVGRLEPYKRCDLMLEAMPTILDHVAEARLIVVGDGSARESLVARANELGICHAVLFTGFVPEAEKIAELQRAAVVVNTSEKEGWGMTVIEGNACGAPSVSTDVPGLRDSVRDGQTGVLVPYGNVAAVAEAVVDVLTDPGLHARLTSNAAAWASKFSWDNVADDAANLIGEAITPTGAAVPLVASPFEPGQ